MSACVEGAANRYFQAALKCNCKHLKGGKGTERAAGAHKWIAEIILRGIEGAYNKTANVSR